MALKTKTSIRKYRKRVSITLEGRGTPHLSLQRPLHWNVSFLVSSQAQVSAQVAHKIQQKGQIFPADIRGIYPTHYREREKQHIKKITLG